jgi:hypothetical protein
MIMNSTIAGMMIITDVDKVENRPVIKKNNIMKSFALSVSNGEACILRKKIRWLSLLNKSKIIANDIIRRPARIEASGVKPEALFRP